MQEKEREGPEDRGRVIFVGAHPDDIELGCGGTVASFAKCGFDVQCVVLSDGGACGDPELRKRESLRALRKLGHLGGVEFGGFPDRSIPESAEVIDFLEKFYMDNVSGHREIRVSVYAAFIHTEEDIHQDHRAAARCCRIAFRGVPRIYAYESPTTTGRFNPTSFVDITGYREIKRDALKCHKSQLKRRASYLEYKAMRELASFRGRACDAEYAEAFETLKNLVEVAGPTPRPPKA